MCLSVVGSLLFFNDDFVAEWVSEMSLFYNTWQKLGSLLLWTTQTFIWQKNVARADICKVSDEVEKTEGASKQSSSAGCNQRGYEQSVVAWTDAVVQPLAVVVEVSNALVARTAVFRLWRPSHQRRSILKIYLKYISPQDDLSVVF